MENAGISHTENSEEEQRKHIQAIIEEQSKAIPVKDLQELKGLLVNEENKKYLKIIEKIDKKINPLFLRAIRKDLTLEELKELETELNDFLMKYRYVEHAGQLKFVVNEKLNEQLSVKLKKTVRSLEDMAETVVSMIKLSGDNRGNEGSHIAELLNEKDTDQFLRVLSKNLIDPRNKPMTYNFLELQRFFRLKEKIKVTNTQVKKVRATLKEYIQKYYDNATQEMFAEYMKGTFARSNGNSFGKDERRQFSSDCLPYGAPVFE